MHRFTEKDIATIKDKINTLIWRLGVGRDWELDPAVAAKIISEEQKQSIISFVISKQSIISLEPLPKELSPLIDVAKHLIEKEAKKPKYTYNYDTYFEDLWDYDYGASSRSYYG